MTSLGCDSFSYCSKLQEAVVPKGVYVFQKNLKDYGYRGDAVSLPAADPVNQSVTENCFVCSPTHIRYYSVSRH